MVRTVRGLFVAALLVGGAVDAASQPPEQAPAEEAPEIVSCYEQATDETLLSEREVLELCQGAPAAGPVECFEAAQDELLLSEYQLIRLCRCAQDAQPVACFERMDEETFLDDEQLIDICSPTRSQGLTDACLPIYGPVGPYR